MGITKEEVEYIARLARLEFDETEKEAFTHQLDKILEYVDKINELDTSHVQPSSHVIPLENVLREDNVKESLPRDLVLANAPKKERGYFKVPKVIE
ncbi:MAG: Asp-tRNA(Asn)/Glu-tRNA(Gln) amidotransferase subunit GatC [bacterium]|nr:Asp-tRNA(Asn)/Glu-tRNA(Gln) amidotransferase subunit GatC [bacterium]